MPLIGHPPTSSLEPIVYATKALAELNRGQAKAAAPFIEKALDVAGRTSDRVNLLQARIRGDAALVYAKLDNQENVRKYLTYSGAGHVPDGQWLNSTVGDPPVCDTDVTPQDSAVVEFAIGKDGHAAGATPIYASRPGPIGTTFAAAVKQWRWRPATLAKLDPFWRASVRIELRCIKRPPPLQLGDSFRDATEAWLAQTGYTVELDDPTSQPDALPAGGAAAIAADFIRLSSATSDKDASAAAASLQAKLDAAKAPIEVRAYALYLASRPHRSGSWRGNDALEARKLTTALDRLQNQPGAERAGAWLRTEAAIDMEESGSLDSARQTLQGVTALPERALPADDPIRSLALLHLSLIDKQQGKAAQADARLAAAGINADQCSLLDVRPVPRNREISSSAFPTEAVRWRFEGRVREAFDIAADGSVADVRTVIAYPPFVFGPATEKAVSNFRYVPPTLGDQPLGCVGQTLNVRYALPN